MLDGDLRHELSGVSDATRQSDGTIVVGNCLTGELRYFAADGGFIRAVGGLGEGPGEYGFLRRIFRLGGDTLGVFDGTRLRVTVVAPDGGLVGEHGPLSPLPGYPDVLGRLDNGLFVVREIGRPRRPSGAQPTSRTTTTLLLVDDSGRRVDSVMGLPARDVASPDDARAPTVVPRLTRDAVFAVHPEGVYYGGQDDAGVQGFDAQLERRDVVRTVTRPDPVTDAMKSAFQAMVDAGAHMPAGGIGPVLADVYAPEMPAFGDLIAGRDGRLWVEDPLRPGHYPLVWTAYEGGAAAVRVEIPPRFFPFEFGRDWVLGVSFDELGVERIELWNLVPGELPGRILPPRDAEPPNHSRCGPWGSR
jgi:hypothetical protein